MIKIEFDRKGYNKKYDIYETYYMAKSKIKNIYTETNDNEIRIYELKVKKIKIGVAGEETITVYKIIKILTNIYITPAAN